MAIAELDGDHQLCADFQRRIDLGSHEIWFDCRKLDSALFGAVLDDDASRGTLRRNWLVAIIGEVERDLIALYG